ncbi:type III restriction-modification system endonuclease [Chryseobacterium aquaticum]|uniref:Type III restriction-modification system endonuclease n=1 Tax=Chryseobacterium aquaticum TaxID=452084 RepID=A0A848N269_9FLAO|nr:MULTISPECIES: type III restriction-modification system endonuclease [Chryseobacterium]NMR33092.1 type III restriction-modification system endonuclease [Chryseobacterium aquaticum]NRQ44977.1 type III restriction-modification system endonuclease [Chryseobacterium sp. C-204]
MEIILKTGLPHQEKGFHAIADALHEDLIQKNDLYYQNPTLVLDRELLMTQMAKVQKANAVASEYKALNEIGASLNLDIKMETGTGKTYVYTAAMFELHKRYGINKFIVVVPTLAIKAGAKQFMEDAYTQRHFRDQCGYNTELDLLVLEASKKRKGKNYFPSVVREFVSGSSQNANKIYVMLTNMSLLGGTSKLLTDTYDYGVEGFYKPIEGIRATRPFVIIDEPHRFNKTQKAYQFIEKEIQPQALIRLGATFPEISIGKGKNKITRKDYTNLLYDLSAFEAFNQNLIKGIAKEHFEPITQKQDKIKITSISSKTSAKFTLIQKDQPNKIFELQKGDSLGMISPELEGVVIDAITNSTIELSNGQVKSQGEEFNTDIYSSSYQESMLKLAIERHFETERINFSRNTKIKTLALFFIDDIYSYRVNDKQDKQPYLKAMFERLLMEKTDSIIPKLTEQESEYRDYLLASKADAEATHAGYFSQDNSSADDAIAQEVQEILFEKKKLLSIKNEDGTYNTRRFLFSKWTLKEGWDNPNVFTIAKLRSSGSENSKLQEVGRGLRLPVDEFGNRISNETFKLNYIIDFTEADFADRLVNEINQQLPKGFELSDEQISTVALKMEIDPDDLFVELIGKKYIDRKGNIKPENAEQFFTEYPEFTVGLQPGKITDRNKKPDAKVKIRKGVFDEMKALWEAINSKYILHYEKVEEEDYLFNEVLALFRKGVFAQVYISSRRAELNTEGTNASVKEDAGVQFKIKRQINYGDFLKRINRQTNLPIELIHRVLMAYSKEQKIDDERINEQSVANFVKEFSDWKIEKLAGRFSYSKANLGKKATSLTYADGSPKSEITQGLIGTKFIEGTPVEKYLYDVYAFDSPLEKDNIVLSGIDEIVVYGKIPKSSISIPTITGQSYSPDFMYLVKKDNGDKILNVIVETKDMDKESTLRKIEDAKIDCAKEFFNQLTIDGYKVEFKTQLNNTKIRQIIDEVLED